MPVKVLIVRYIRVSSVKGKSLRKFRFIRNSFFFTRKKCRKFSFFREISHQFVTRKWKIGNVKISRKNAKRRKFPEKKRIFFLIYWKFKCWGLRAVYSTINCCCNNTWFSRIFFAKFSHFASYSHCIFFRWQLRYLENSALTGSRLHIFHKNVSFNVLFFFSYTCNIYFNNFSHIYFLNLFVEGPKRKIFLWRPLLSKE